MRRHMTLTPMFGVPLLALIALLAVFITACGSQTRAETRIKKAQGLAAELESYNAATHASGEFEQVRSLLSSAQSAANGGDFNGALDSAVQAVNQATALLPRVQEMEATAQVQAMEADIRVAQLNGLDNTDPNRWNKIQELQGKVNELRGKEDFKGVVETAKTARGEVDNGIASLRNRADVARIEAQKEIDRLRSEGGPLWDPSSVSSAASQMTAAAQIFENDRNYGLAETRFREVAKIAQEGIRNTFRARSDKAIDDVTKNLAVSREENGEKLAAADFERTTQLLNSMTENRNKELYEAVLEIANDARPRSEKLVEDTKRAASDVRIDEMATIIDGLTADGAREYLAARVGSLDSLLATARETRRADTVAAFDSVKDLYLKAMAETERLDASFRSLGTDAITAAANQLDASQAVYNEVPSIFERRTNVPAELKSVEEAREGKRAELGKVLEAARAAVEAAKGDIEAKRYRRAIVTAEEQETRGKAVLNETYALIANNGLIELSMLVSQADRDGAALYAPDELARSRQSVEDIRKAIAEAQFEKAIQMAGSARADIALIQQRLAGKAREDLDAARGIFDAVRGLGAPSAPAAPSAPSAPATSGTDDSDLVAAAAVGASSPKMAEADNLIRQAEEALDAGNLKGALEKSAAAVRLAREAQIEAEKASAEAVLSQVDATLAKARAAGAETWAGELVDDAQRMAQAADSLYRSQDFRGADQVARMAAERASQALTAKVDAADVAVSDAQALGAWGVNDKKLSIAVVDAREARAALDAGSYEASNRKADSARARAESLIRDTKRENYNATRARLIENLEVGRRQGLNTFQVEEALAARTRLAELDNAYSAEGYEKVMIELAETEGRLRSALDTTGTFVQSVLDQQNARLTAQIDRGAEDYAPEVVRNARYDLMHAGIKFDDGAVGTARVHLDRAIASIDELERRAHYEDYAVEAMQLIERYGRAQRAFENVLSLSPATVKNLAFGTLARSSNVAIPGTVNAVGFRAELDKIYSEAIRLTPPENMRFYHDALIHSLNDGRVAAIAFERFLILNETSVTQGEKVIDEAYSRLNRSNDRLADLNEQLLRNRMDFRLTTAEANRL